MMAARIIGRNSDRSYMCELQRRAQTRAGRPEKWVRCMLPRRPECKADQICASRATCGGLVRRGEEEQHLADCHGGAPGQWEPVTKTDREED
jgi:hypothetical protein